jgi:predicted ribosome quality control (RQC) complex YloA/Tae2 family protein
MSEIPAANELKELEEHSHDLFNRRIGLLISVIAILLAICGALGRKAENLVIVARVDASNTWAHFQAKKLRGYQSETTHDLAQLIAQGSQKGASQEVAERYEAKVKKYEQESEKIAQEAEAYTQKAEKWENRANRFSLGEIFLQIAVVLCSIAILTEAVTFVYGGLGFAAVGIFCALSVIFIH